MSKTVMTATWMSGLLLALLAARPVAADPPPLQDFPKGGMTPANQQNMKDRINYYANQFLEAKTDSEAIAARNGLLADSNTYEAKDAAYIYTQQAAELLPDLFVRFQKDPLRQVKEVNLAMALSEMSQVPIQPALDVMVSYQRDPAVRYYGWRGYKAARTRIFAQGMQWVKKTYDVLDKAAATEDSAQALGAIFSMLELESPPPTVVSKDSWDFAQKQSLEILRKHWPDWCLQVRQGDEEITDVCHRGVSALQSVAGLGDQDKPIHKDVLQMLVNMAWCAGKSYVDIKKLGRPADADAQLLRVCENALNAVAGMQKRYIERPLTEAKVAAEPETVMWWVDPASNENYGVLAWVDALKPEGVAKPKDPAAPKPASAPAAATAPAK